MSDLTKQEMERLEKATGFAALTMFFGVIAFVFGVIAFYMFIVSNSHEGAKPLIIAGVFYALTLICKHTGITTLIFGSKNNA